MDTFREQLRGYRVLPVVTAHDVESTVKLAQALAAGGVQAIELTLRTPAALDAIRAVRETLPQMSVASGTVTNPEQLQAAIDAGCEFHVSPGLTPALLDAAHESAAQLLPGVGGASEVMLGLDSGLRNFKLFPAVAVGGLTMLKSLAGPFPDVCFCPTGGLGEANFREFLGLSNVMCCGGSWMVSADLVEAGRWDEVTALAAAALKQ